MIGNDCTSSCKFNYHTITTALKNMNNLMVTGTYRIILYINQHFLLKFLYLYMYMNSTAVKKRYCRVNKHLIILIIVLTHLGRLKTKHASNCHHLITICCILATRQFQPNVDGKDLKKWAGLLVSLVFNTNFTNISFISWRSVLLVEETGENH